MRCSTCGAEVVEEAIYCHQCGARLQTIGAGAAAGEVNRTEADAPQLDISAGPSASQEDTAQQPPAGTPAERLLAAARHTGDAEDDREEELWEGGYSPRAMAANWVFSGALTLVLLVVWVWKVRNSTAWLALVAGLLLLWIGQLLVLVYRRMSVHYELTTQRLVHQRGILRRVTDRIELIDVDDITFEQGLIDRLTGVGTIRVISSDRTHPELLLRGIENVREVAAVIDDARRAERRRRGLHIEAI